MPNLVKIGPFVLVKISEFCVGTLYLKQGTGQEVALYLNKIIVLVVLEKKIFKSLNDLIALVVLEKKIFKSCGEDSQKLSINLFLLFPNYFHLGKEVVLYLNKLETTSPKYALCRVWLELVQWFC